MTEPVSQLDARSAMQQVAPSWDGARTERTLDGARGKLGARRRRTRVLSGVAALGVVLALASVWLGDVGEAPVARQAVGAERVVSFEDGSRASLLDAEARVVVAAVSPSAIDVSLSAGRARFDVAARPERTFRVSSGVVVVQVLGTSFELTREGERTHVQVLRGRVAVRWPSGATELDAGAAAWFPPAASLATPELRPSSEAQPAGDAEVTAQRRAKAATWRQHAEQGDFTQAYALLEAERARVADDVEELLLAADAARLSGHAAQAVPFLQKVVERHAEDPRAPLAAFTLGGVLMNQLGRPREADAAYGQARTMSPQSSLSQDALARQVEAAHRASDSARARLLGLEYLERYPDGRRVQAVRRFSGLP